MGCLNRMNYLHGTYERYDIARLFDNNLRWIFRCQYGGYGGYTVDFREIEQSHGCGRFLCVDKVDTLLISVKINNRKGKYGGYTVQIIVIGYKGNR